MKQKRVRKFVYMGVVLILLLILVGYFVGWLGENPVRAAQLLTGRIAFVFLLASLSITPLRTLTGNISIGPLRKAFGLSAFYVAAAHMIILVVLGYRFNFAYLLEDLAYRSYIWPGAAALLILTILAVTSIDKVKKAVRSAWKKIHMLVYPAGVLVLVHFSWISNGKLIPDGEFKALPFLAGLYLMALFILRLKPVKEAIIHRRKERTAVLTADG